MQLFVILFLLILQGSGIVAPLMDFFHLVPSMSTIPISFSFYGYTDYLSDNSILIHITSGSLTLNGKNYLVTNEVTGSGNTNYLEAPTSLSPFSGMTLLTNGIDMSMSVLHGNPIGQFEFAYFGSGNPYPGLTTLTQNGQLFAYVHAMGSITTMNNGVEIDGYGYAVKVSDYVENEGGTHVIGLKDLLTLNNLSINNITPSQIDATESSCPDGIFVTLTKCFSIQQNFFVSQLGSKSPHYWVQNVIMIGVDSQGHVFTDGVYLVETSANANLLSCDSIFLIGNSCYRLYTYRQVTLPVTFNLTSIIAGNELVMYNNNKEFSFSVPQGWYIYEDPNHCNMEPALSIVGPYDAEGVIFGSSTSGSVTSYADIDGTWYDAKIQTASLGCTYTLESSHGLRWSSTGMSTETFSFQDDSSDQGIFHQEQ